MIELVSPVGNPRVDDVQAERRVLDTVVGRCVGFIWNQYPVTRQFWIKFEHALESAAKPARIERAYKNNTWMPLEAARFNEIARSADYLVVGVGA